MTQSIEKKISAAATVVNLATISLFPLFMLPITTNFYDTNKLALLIVATCLLLILYAVRTMVTKTLRFEFPPFILPLLGFGAIHFISPFITTPASVVEPLMNRGSFFIALALYVTASVNLIQERRFVRFATHALIGSATALAIISLFQSFGFGLSNLINSVAGTTLPNTLTFTPSGSPVVLLTFLIPTVALSLVLAFTKTDAGDKVSLFVLSGIIASAILVLAVYSMPGKESSATFLPLQSGYTIAVDTLKYPKQALFGVGTNSFAVAYNMLRPNAINTTNFWNVRFSMSSTEILHLLATVGLTGLASFGLIILSMVKSAKSATTSIQLRSLKVAAFTSAILFFLVPGNFVLYFSFAVVLGLWSLSIKLNTPDSIKSYQLTLTDNPSKYVAIKRIGVFAPAVLTLGLVAASLYFGVNAYAAEITFMNSINAAAKNDGLQTYNLQRDAILRNPYLPRYRRSYAATNLALANALASNPDITDQDKQNVGQLIQQAIREAKIAANLEPDNATNWENLAAIYRSLINGVQDADQWTIAAMAQAIQTDPINPSLRVELGGVYYTLGAYDQAIRLFQQAAELKGDYANAYYNLSHAYLEKKDVIAAYDYLRQTLSLTPADSADYTKAKQELEELAKQLPKQQTSTETDPIAPATTELQVAPPVASSSTAVNLPTNSGPENIGTTTPTTPATDINP